MMLQDLILIFLISWTVAQKPGETKYEKLLYSELYYAHEAPSWKKNR